MKFIHLSDLHLGKRVNEFSMIEDQKYILTKILNIIDENKPDGLLIAGDVYDKYIPPVEAIELFDDFLTRLASRKLPVFIISGNHDSAERMTFGSKLMDISGIHFAKTYDGTVEPFTLSDSHGDVKIYMLPFIKPVIVKSLFPEESENINSYSDAVKVAIEHMNLNKDDNTRKILIAHQFVTGAIRSESEEISVGGSDNVNASIFYDFDYVALGHIHGPQKVEKEYIRYCGTPLKYSFSEINHNKGVGLVELKEKGQLTYQHIPLIPKRDFKEVKGTFNQIMSKEFYKDFNLDDYFSIILTDEEDVPDGFAKLNTIYKNLMKINYDNARTRHTNEINNLGNIKEIDPLELFQDFYELQNNMPMSDEQKDFSRQLIQNIWN